MPVQNTPQDMDFQQGLQYWTHFCHKLNPMYADNELFARIINSPAQVNGQVPGDIQVLVSKSKAEVANIGSPKQKEPDRRKTEFGLTAVKISPFQVYESEPIEAEEAATNTELLPGIIQLPNTGQYFQDNAESYKQRRVVAMNNRRIRARQKQAADLIADGKCEYDIKDPITNKVKGKVKYEPGVTVENYSLANTTDVYKDMNDICEDMSAQGFAPDLVIVTPNVMDKFFSNTKLDKYINKQMLGAVGMERKVKGNFKSSFSWEKGAIPSVEKYIGEYTVGEERVKYIKQESANKGKIIYINFSSFRYSWCNIYKMFNKSRVSLPVEVVSWESYDTETYDSMMIYHQSRFLTWLEDIRGLRIQNVTLS